MSSKISRENNRQSLQNARTKEKREHVTGSITFAVSGSIIYVQLEKASELKKTRIHTKHISVN